MRLTIGQLRQIIRESQRFPKRTFEEFQERWDNKPVYVRFENNSPGIPVSLNRDFTYGDIFGIWSFYLEYGWPEKPAYLTRMSDVYIFEVKTDRVLDTSTYNEAALKSDVGKLRKLYGSAVDNAQNNEDRKRDIWPSEVGTEYDQQLLSEMSPGRQLYQIVSQIKGSTKSTNFIFRNLGYDVIIDSGADVSEGVYAPAVSAVVLDPRVVNIIDSFHRSVR